MDPIQSAEATPERRETVAKQAPVTARTPSTSSNDNVTASKSQTTALETPDILKDKYQFIRELGEGANGKTYLARVIYSDSYVAIKCLKMNMVENLKAVDLFKREAAVLESIRVNGVPKYYESIIPETGNPDDNYYIIQEYIQYPSLEAQLETKKQFTEDEVLNVLDGLCSILSSLQEQYTPPIIHRDIKPSNILMNPHGGKASVYLIDFGAVANPQKHQGGSTIAGTFGYMAPEQQLGDVAIQSDYYAVGATALHLLTGVMPYDIPSDVFKLQYEPVLEQKAPQTSCAMRELLDMLLASDIGKRPKNMAELRSYIKQVRSLQGVTANDVKHGIPRTFIGSLILCVECLVLFVATFFLPAFSLLFFDRILLAIVMAIALFGAIVAYRKKRKLDEKQGEKLLHAPIVYASAFAFDKKETGLIGATPEEIAAAEAEEAEIIQSYEDIRKPKLVRRKNLWTPPKSWSTTQGKIMGFTYVDAHEAFEYIFEAGGERYFGVSRFFDGINLKFPLTCTVAYNPNEPRSNVLTDIDPIMDV